MIKTIKQIADELKTDKQKVYRFIKRNHISEAHQENGVMYYDEAAETLIKQELLETSASSDVHQNHITDAVNEAVFDILRNELEAKNKLIDDLKSELAIERQHSREQYDKLSQLADQSQRLQLAQLNTNEPLKLLQEQNDSNREKKTKQSFLNRIFQKSKESPP